MSYRLSGEVSPYAMATARIRFTAAPWPAPDFKPFARRQKILALVAAIGS